MIRQERRRWLMRNIMDPYSDREAVALKWWILSHLLKGDLSADQIYTGSECTDQAMYLALHRLVKTKFVTGISPYDDDIVGNHTKWWYRLADTKAALRLAEVAVIKAKAWDPKIYAVSSLNMETQPHAAN